MKKELPKLPQGLSFHRAIQRLTNALDRTNGFKVQEGELMKAIRIPDDQECFRTLCKLAETSRLDIPAILKGSDSDQSATFSVPKAG